VTRPRTAPGNGVGFSVTDALAGFDDDRLLRLLRSRPDLTTPPPRDLAALASRLEDRESMVACVNQLNLTDRQVLEALCLLPRPTTVSRLAASLGDHIDRGELCQPLERLAERALVFHDGERDGEEVRLLPAAERLEDPARLGPRLHDVLGRRTVQEVSDVARRLGVRPRSPKSAMLDAVAEVLSDPDRVRGLLARAPSGAAELAQQLATETPRVSVPDLYAQLYYRKHDETALIWLVRTGMLVQTEWDLAVMPREVALALRGGRPFPDFAVEPPPVPVARVDPDEVDRVAAARALRLVADIAAVLDEWGERPAKLLKSGGVGVREVRRVATAGDRSETEAARILELAAVLGLVAANPDDGLVMPSTDCDDWLALPAPARWARLVGAWLRADRHLAVAGASDGNGKPIPPLLSRVPEPDAGRRRRIVLDALADVEPGHTPDLDALQRRVVWEAPGTWQGGPAAAATLVRWVFDEAELLGLVGCGTLSSAGRLAAAGGGDAAGGGEDAAAAALARWAPQVITTFVVQADLTAIAAGDLDGAVRRELQLLADVESKGAATVYRFSEASLRRGFDAGRTAAEIDAFLDRHAERGVPQPLRYLVADIGRRHGQVRIGTASCYLRCDDPALLAEILRARKTASLRLRQLAPTVLLSDAEPEAVLATLRKAGYLPTRESADGTVLAVVQGPLRAAVPPPRRAGPLDDAFRDDAATMALMRAYPELLDRFGLTRAEHGVAPLDPAELVAQLRGAPVRTPEAADPLARDMDNVLHLFPLNGVLDLLDDDAQDRPTEIARGRDSVRALLDLACDEDWVVRIAHTSAQGGTTELYAYPLELTRSHLVADCPPHWETRRFPLDRIAWARVTTEAEEERLA